MIFFLEYQDFYGDTFFTWILNIRSNIKVAYIPQYWSVMEIKLIISVVLLNVLSKNTFRLIMIEYIILNVFLSYQDNI